MPDLESNELHERARRALQVNPHRREEPEVHMSEAVQGEPEAARTPAIPKPPNPHSDPYAADLGRRMRAIHRLREEGPLLENCVENHTYWTHKLAHMPSDSVEYSTTLERLREVHTALMLLKQRREEDEAIIRSTNYLVPLLRSPEIQAVTVPAKS